MGTFLTVLSVICAVGVIYRVISGAWTGQKSYLLDGTEVKISKSQTKHTEAAEASDLHSRRHRASLPGRLGRQSP